jgi:uncharacterized membrane protein
MSALAFCCSLSFGVGHMAAATLAALYHVFALSGNGGLVKSGEGVYNRRLSYDAPSCPAAEGMLPLEPKPTELRRLSTPRQRLTAVAVAVAVLIIVLAIEIPPYTLLGKADVVGYAICHRIPERSFIVGGRPLPLCARCTGTFLGVLLGLTAMLLGRRHRASRLPSIPVLGLLVMFTGLWGFDGLNSYMTLIPGGPHLYEPRNWLRLTTGLLNGLTLIILTFPILNFTLWREPTQERVIKNIWELLVLLPVVVLLVFVIQAEIGFLLYPLALLSSLGVVMMLVLINSMIATIALGREGYALSWRQALAPLIVGTGLAVLQITMMVLLRAYLTARLGLPF